MIGIITAVKPELDAFLSLCENVSQQEKNGIIFYLGKINNNDVVIVSSGVGKVLASLVTTALIINYPIKLIINVGTAGALNKDLKVGDLIISKRVAESDFDLTAFGYKRSFNETRVTSYISEDLLKDIEKTIEDKTGVYFSDLVSSDKFINNKGQLDETLKHFETALATDMEAAAIAKVAGFYKIKWIIIRSISDYVLADNNVLDYKDNVKKASKQAALLAVSLIDEIIINNDN